MEIDNQLKELLMLAIQENASDLHFTENSSPILRVDGRLVLVQKPALSAHELKDMIYGVLNPGQIKQFEQDKELDFSLAINGMDRFRVNVHNQRGCVEAALRRIPLYIPSIEDLQLPSVVADLARKQTGLVLITGATGAGKSTTLASMINLINHERSAVVISVEDPIEFIHQNNKSIIKQREVYRDTNSFAEALKRCLRQDPDVIVVGEMRDLETISTAITAAETGHLVLATLHTPDAPQTIERVIDVFPPYQQTQVRLQLAAALEGVISQQLVPRASGIGRVMIPEIMIATSAIRNMIREQTTEQMRSAIQTGGQYGMKTMDKSLKEACDKGVITFETALLHAHNMDDFKALFKNM